MYSYTHRKDIAKQEMDDLPKRAMRFMDKVETSVRVIHDDDSIRLYLSQNNQYKLLTLKVWSERYRVDLDYILGLLLPFWASFVGKRSGKVRAKGLNVRIPTLVGKKSEQILKESLTEKVQDDFKRIYISLERERLYYEMQIRKMQEDKFLPKQKLKSLFDFKSPMEYADAYMARMEQESISREKIMEEFMRRPYRGNPFREETV